MSRSNRLIRRLRELLGPQIDAAFDAAEPEASTAKWDGWYESILQKAAHLGQEVERNRRLIGDRYGDFEHSPVGRRETVWNNSPPFMLLALARDLIDSSFMFRFTDPKRSLLLAELALETADRLDASVVSEEVKADVQGEALCYLANARRINGDLRTAEVAFSEGRERLAEGTGDLELRADYLSLFASLEFAKGNGRRALALQDREIKLRRQLAEPQRLGAALLDRAIVTCWCGPVDTACQLILDAMGYTSEPLRSILALEALGERFARDGDGGRAWQALCAMDSLIIESGLKKMGFDNFLRRCHWTRGLGLRALGDLERSTEQLERVRTEYLDEGQPFLAALVSLDLCTTYAASGDFDKVETLAADAYAAFRSNRLEERALAAILVLQKAARAEELTQELAVQVANFVVRFQADRTVEFRANR